MARLAFALALASAALVASALAQKSTGAESAFHFPNRLAALDSDCFPKADADAETAKLQGEFAAAKLEVDNLMSSGTARIQAAQTALENEMNGKMQALEASTDTVLSGLETTLTETKAALEGQVAANITNLQAEVANALQMYELVRSTQLVNDTANHKYYRNYELIKVAKSPPDTQNNHAGRMFYKVHYNPNLPAHFENDRRELKAACRHLSEDLEAVDGIDRDLKPACDHDRSRNGDEHYCDSDAVFLRGSYLSHCGCGGHPRNRDCVGMSKEFLKGAVMYNRDHSWSGCRMLRNNGDCNHQWIECNQNHDTKAEYTICTSDNDNFKL